MTSDQTDFDRSIFINCPFDQRYKALLRALLFTTLDCGVQPRIVSAAVDSSTARIQKIKDLIRACRFSIHDISRMEPLAKGDLPRFNMPFELGLDLGCKEYGSGALRTKQCLILDRDQYRYQKVISDLSGNDVRTHNDEPEILVINVRNWIHVATGVEVPAGRRIWQRFNIFLGDLALVLEEKGYRKDDLDNLEVKEFIDLAHQWISRRRVK